MTMTSIDKQTPGRKNETGNGTGDDFQLQDFSHEQEGFKRGLKPRQVQMIAIGGAIGTGLFLGAGGRLAGAGPALALVFAICGVFAFFILRSLGELVLHRPSSGSFVSPTLASSTARNSPTWPDGCTSSTGQ